MPTSIQGIGLGLRRAYARELLATDRRIDWLEVTPENWVGFGGERARILHACAERWPLVSHNVNAVNHGFAPRAFIDAMPLERVRQLHLAGHTRQDDRLIIDTHIGPIIDEVWELYRYTLRRAGRLIPTLVEWDQDIPALDEVLDELERARAHAHAALGVPEDAR
ncbi:DUF692 domain-containing protein [Cystobacter fuscus]|uniref:multinuclear nonheme iron-dependent oxidase n=1 Tax=Cystobacter fuscus TaxID=43 RepID=UPI002B2C1A98|nr:DUF692 domain-containing protein [Cystobacter fuscus]